ncbi:MAG: LPS-assembly protein LptD [Planctomycetota bacterium]|nr:MAG: LPS-assembly protein LptD [Planctomycetota bacterium]
MLARLRAPCALRAVDAARRRTAWPRVALLLALVLGAWLSLVPQALGQVELPPGRLADRITLAADSGAHWVEGSYDVYLLEGNCYVNQGLTYARSRQAVLWVERGGPLGNPPHKVIAYLEGDVEISYQPGEAAGEDGIRAAGAAKIADQHWFGRFYSAVPVDVRPTAWVEPPATKPEVYGRAAAQLGRAPPVQQAQFAEPIAPPPPIIAPPPDMLRVRIVPRNYNNLEFDWLPSPDGGQHIAIAKNVTIIVDGLDELGSIDVDTDNLVIWTDGDLRVEGGEAQQSQDRLLHIYMEGNVVFRQGQRTVYAQRMFYDVNRQSGIVLGAEMLTPAPDYDGLLRLQADVVQQLGRDHFIAQNGSITSSRMGIPTYELRSELMTYDDVQHPRINPYTGQPEVDVNGEQIIDHDQLVTSRNNRVYIGQVPVFYWPFLATDLEQPNFYIEDIQIRNDRVFGTQVLTDFDVYQILGLRNPPPATRWTASADYMSERGFGYGTNFDYERQSWFGVPESSGGFLDAWAIKDHGLDDLGLLRRNVPPEKSYRGRVLLQHRSLLDNGFIFTGEVGLISDFNFLEQYFEREYDQLKDQSTDFELKQYLDNSTWSVVGGVRLNNFFTVTEWLPRADHFWIGQPVGERLTWFEHTSVAFARMRSAKGPTDPAQAAMWGPLPWEFPANSTRPGERLITRHEIDLPVEVGPVKVTSYALGELARWGENIDFNPVNRAYGALGTRATTTMWAVDPNVQSQLFNVNGLAHKVVLEVDSFYAQSTLDLDELPLYDPVDDNNIEAYRRWYPFFDFGVPPLLAPLEFDERYYALRRGLGSYVASPSMEIADDLFTIRVGAKQRWQTKRGRPDNPHIIDWMTFDVDATFFPNPDRDNFGTAIGLVDYDYRWHVGDRTTITTSGYYDFFQRAGKYTAVGGFVRRPPRGSIYMGYHSLEGPITSSVVLFNYSYRMSPKWLSSFGTSFDFRDDRNIGQNFMLTRIGESFLMSVIVNVDTSKGNVGANFAIQPRFLQGRLGPVTPMSVPLAGVYGLE